MTQEDLQQKYLASLAEKLAELKSLAKEYQQGQQPAEPKLRAIAHTLHGSGATFGYPLLSTTAKTTELASQNDLLAKTDELMAVLSQITTEAATSARDVQNILIIDDDTDFADSLIAGFALLAGRYRVFHADTAGKAQEYLVKQRFSLILLDLVMPDRDGRDLLREIKLEFNIPTPVYVVSGIEKDLIRIECMALGADKFINKPVDVEALVSAIDKMLKKNVKRELSLVPMGSEIEAAAAAAEKKADPLAKVSVSGMTILIAEDDPMQASVIRQRLLKEGMTVDHALNGQEVISSMNSKEYALFILDVNMPKMDGFEVLQRIRKDPVTMNTPVIMLTAMGSESDIIKAYDQGANDYILKPFSAIQLVARVKSLLKKPK
jgi:DNA-binding response OmpR family regulator